MFLSLPSWVIALVPYAHFLEQKGRVLDSAGSRAKSLYQDFGGKEGTDWQHRFLPTVYHIDSPFVRSIINPQRKVFSEYFLHPLRKRYNITIVYRSSSKQAFRFYCR